MKKLKSFIFPGYMDYLTYVLLILAILETLLSILRILGIILDSSLTKSFYFINISNFMLIKFCSWSSTWKCLETQYVNFFPHQKHLLYRTCILSIALYEFLLWHYNKAIIKWTTYLFVIFESWVHSQRFRSDSEVQ